VEQQGYARVADGRIVKLDLVCSGFQRVPQRPAAGEKSRSEVSRSNERC
jgi:hypothetical protein